MKFAAFDLEIAKEIPEAVDDWHSLSPLGISCAALALSDGTAVHFWHAAPKLTQAECRAIVGHLQQLVECGYTLLTWNGCAFDFQVLAEESGLCADCAQLAWGHVDLMLRVTFEKGWFLAFEKALKGAGLEGKRKIVTLADGSELTEMNGARAPSLWAAGEYEAVLSYLHDDVTQLLKLAAVVQRDRAIKWVSNRGNPQRVEIPRLLTVRECFNIPEPDVSWMNKPPTRQQFVSWMANHVDWRRAPQLSRSIAGPYKQNPPQGRIREDGGPKYSPAARPSQPAASVSHMSSYNSSATEGGCSSNALSLLTIVTLAGLLLSTSFRLLVRTTLKAI